ncbi:MAG: N-formylglutamate amidohydrolase [Alphaproteobacteria bacterium]|nr:N-formylglutamate amidohydrolase [Alphaproteobacteria bacterium]
MNERFSGSREGRGVADAAGEAPARVVEVIEPGIQTSPLIYASPHSGRRYAPEFLAISRLDRHALRQSEDGYVDLLFDDAPRFGSPLLRALFPRAYVDVNRARNEIDPRMFVDPETEEVDPRSHRVRAGLGVIPRIVADGHDIYSRKLKFFEARRRLETCYDPYHRALADLIGRTRAEFGCAVVIDCHSMPSLGGAPFRRGERAIDFVLGDRYGSSCASSLTALVEQSLASMGYAVSRNNPYAGGHVAATYGRPDEGVHVLQIEINRSLYLDERRLARHDGFAGLRESICQLIDSLGDISPYFLRPAHAAE